MEKKQKTKKGKIGYQRLSRIITSRECRSAQDFNLLLYSSLTPIQRQEIKEMLERNRSLTND